MWYLTEGERRMAVEEEEGVTRKEGRARKYIVAVVGLCKKGVGIAGVVGVVMLWNTLLALFLKSHPRNEYTVQQWDD